MKKFNAYLGMAVSSWLLTVLIIASEIFEPFKNFLKDTFYHHWIGKGIIITLAFIIFGCLLKETKSDEKISWFSFIGSLIIIFLFFVLEYFI